MPFFQYTATDREGKSLTGTIQAQSTVEANSELSKRGFQNVQFLNDSSEMSLKKNRVYRANKASDQQLFFYFSQLASMAKAGINPHQAFESISKRVRHTGLQKASQEIAIQVAEGRAISSIMDSYIGTFPHESIGMVRAAEYGGFLPEAFEYLAAHYSESSSYRKWFWFTKLAGWQGIIGLTLALPIMPALWETFHAGGTLSHFIFLYTKKLLLQWMPITLAIIFFYYLIKRLFNSPQFTILRHQITLKIPWGIGSRARRQSLVMFLWTLRNVARGGVAPVTAWELAAGATPNVAYAIQLRKAANLLGTERPLSDAMIQVGLFPEDYSSLLRIAEEAGDVVATLDRMTNLASEEFELAKKGARTGILTIGCLLAAILSVALAFIVMSGYFLRIFDEVEKYMNS